MPRALFLCGVPASGKSTYAASLLAQSDAVYLSSDALIEDWAEEAGLSYAEAYPDMRDKAKAELENRLAYALEMKSDIIWDQTNLTWEERETRLSRFDGYDLIAIAFEAPASVLDARLKAREAETGKHIPPDVVLAQRAAYMRPHFDEGFDEIVLVTPKGAERL